MIQISLNKKYIYKITFIYFSCILINPSHTLHRNLILLLRHNLYAKYLQVLHLLHNFNLRLLFSILPLLKPHFQLLVRLNLNYFEEP